MQVRNKCGSSVNDPNLLELKRDWKALKSQGMKPLFCFKKNLAQVSRNRKFAICLLAFDMVISVQFQNESCIQYNYFQSISKLFLLGVNKTRKMLFSTIQSISFKHCAPYFHQAIQSGNNSNPWIWEPRTHAKSSKLSKCPKVSFLQKWDVQGLMYTRTRLYWLRQPFNSVQFQDMAPSQMCLTNWKYYCNGRVWVF